AKLAIIAFPPGRRHRPASVTQACSRLGPPPNERIPRAAPERARWKRWLRASRPYVLAGMLAVFGISAGFLVPYMWAVDRWMQHEFGRLSWQIPTRVYARPLVLTPGLALNEAALRE